MSGYLNSPGALLAIAFPPMCGFKGAITALSDLARSDYRSPRFLSRREAAKAIFERNLECRSPGKGSKAMRREAELALAAMEPAAPLSPSEIDLLAERYSEGRVYQRSNSLSFAR